jgi:hypothetical protein
MAGEMTAGATRETLTGCKGLARCEVGSGERLGLVKGHVVSGLARQGRFAA